MNTKRVHFKLPADPRQHRLIQIFFFVLFLAIGYLFVKMFLPYLTAIILATICAAVFYPLYKRLLRKLNGRASLAAGLMCALVVLLVVAPIGAFAGVLTREAIDFASTARDQISEDEIDTLLHGGGPISEGFVVVQDRFGITLDPEAVKTSILDAAKNIGLRVASSTGAIAGSVLGGLLQFLLMIFTLFYLFKDGRALAEYLVDLSPLPDKQERHIIRRFKDVGGAVLYGNLVSAGLQGLFGGIGFAIFGLPGAFLWGAVMGVLALIPLLGTLFVFIPATVILVLQGEWGLAIGFLIYNVIAANVLDNWLKPKLIERKLQAHPLLVFFSIIGGLSVFGAFGLLYGPIIMVIFLALLEIYKKDFRDPSLASAVQEDGGVGEEF